MHGLQGRNAVVTGAASGIGRAVALRLAAEGARVGVLDIDPAGAAETVALVRDAGGSAAAHEVDITDLEAVRLAVAAFAAETGEPDVLVNNAGWDKLGAFLDTEPELWRRIVDLNLWGFLHVTHAVASRMRARGAGRIVNIASDAARVGSMGEGVYSACKGGMVTFTKTLARELARHAVTVNAVCPGPIETPLLQSFADDGDFGAKVVAGMQRLTPMGRLGRPDDLPGLVAFLASDDAAFITGQVISVSGGLTMAG